MDTLATKEQVAEYLQVKPGTLDAWAKQGRGPAYFKVEGSRRYDWTDVKAWVAARKVVHA
jgi:excisionase family DNA binding protein